MPRLSLSLLGGFQARLDHEVVSGFQSDKARALLAYLAVEAGQAHRRDRLVGLFWPDWPEANARANLRHALNNLRTVLGDQSAAPPFLLSDRQTIRFNPDSDHHLDVAEFSRQLEEPATLGTEGLVPAWQQAVALYGGPFLSGFFLEACASFEEWSLLTRERLQLQLLSALRRLSGYFEQRGEYEPALGYARRWVEVDALQEEAQRQLMRLLALTGQRSAALVQFESCRQLLAEELGVAPNPETVALHQQIQSGKLLLPAESRPPPAASPPAKARPPHNLPAQTTHFVGRTAELAALRDRLLSPKVRLLTLTGPGGTGKSRLSLELAAGLLEHFPDGVFFVPLAPLRDPALTGATIAETLAVRETGERSLVARLKEHLQGKQLLLVLDNFEHVTEAAPLVSDLLEAAAGLKVLITSRTLLRLYGEHHYPVPPLPLPDPQAAVSPEQLLANEACQLFVDRAQAIKPDFSLDPATVRTVAEICARVDGLPLAIELAAARIRLLPPQKILGQLSSRLQFLTRGARNLPVRHQTLRNTIDWSYELLEPAEQRLFRRLAVFAGSCSLAAAEAVVDLAAELDLFEGLESLIDKSLLKQMDTAAEPRFMMLETIREYGLERLRTSGETEPVLQNCVSYYLGWAQEMAQLLQDCEEEACVDQVEAEHANLRALLRWVGENDRAETGLELVALLWRFWEMRGHFSEGRQWLEQALIKSEEAALALRAEVYTGAGTMAWYQSDYQAATTHHQAALNLYRNLGDEEGVAFALNNLGVQARNQGDYEQAAKFYEESLALATQLGAQLRMSYTLHNLGEVVRRQGNYERALALTEEALAIMREQGNKWMVARQLKNVGEMHLFLGNYRQTARYYSESLILSGELNNNECIAICLEGYAKLALVQAQPERAARLWGVAEKLREVSGVPLPLADRQEYDGDVALVYDALGEAVFAATWAAGRAMSLEQVLAYALQEAEP